MWKYEDLSAIKLERSIQTQIVLGTTATSMGLKVLSIFFLHLEHIFVLDILEPILKEFLTLLHKEWPNLKVN